MKEGRKLEALAFKRDARQIPSSKRIGALPDSIHGHLSKQRLGGETSNDIENKLLDKQE